MKWSLLWRIFERRERNGPRWNSIKGGDEEREILREEWKMMSLSLSFSFERYDMDIRLEQEKERKSLRKNHFTWEKLYNYQKYDLFIEFENMYIY